ncbi:class E sortase [Streptomyces microflavus]|uniref:class E sortase n=1 Tax=Streptomyces microflavus TaxID=1919 RepID=UPI003810E3DD
MPRTNSTSQPDDADGLQDPAAARRGPRGLTLSAVVATSLAFSALLWMQNGSGADGPAPVAAKTTKPSSGAQSADPLTSGTTPADGDRDAPDDTGTSRNAAARTLSSWSTGNPPARGEHAVGGERGTGPGGRIGEVLRIPALGTGWAQPVYDGVADKQLRAGVGHFPTTEEPGQIGNYALAGHRSGVSDPAFRNIDRITSGTKIQVITAHRITYTYTVRRVRTVAPTDVNVIAQVPGRPDVPPTEAKLTIVTCWPAEGHAKRIVVEADLISAKGGA